MTTADRTATGPSAASADATTPVATPPVAAPPAATPPAATLPAGAPGPARSPLVSTARTVEWSRGIELAAELTAAADARTRHLLEGFVHQAGPPPSRFAWVALGSHARRELHCASDQDHALIWADARAAASSYAADLAEHVIAGLEAFGMRRCDGGYMADRWSLGRDDWIDQARARIAAPTPEAVLETDVFLDVRRLAGDLDLAGAQHILQSGADSRLLHGLAIAGTSFPPPRMAFGRLPHGPIDLKRSGLAPLVLLARLYGLQAGSTELGSIDRLRAAAGRGLLSEELTERLVSGFELLVHLRLTHQLAQADSGQLLDDIVVAATLADEDQRQLREAFRAVRAAQSVTAVTFRTDL